MYIFEARAKEDQRRRELGGSAKSPLRSGAVVAVGSSRVQSGQYPAKLARDGGSPGFSERACNGKAYGVQDACAREVKQATRELRLLDLAAENRPSRG